MGIPSYFSYIIKNHSNIIRDLKFLRNVANVNFQSMYMDCNSLIYDAVRKIEKTPATSFVTSFEDQVIQCVIQKIQAHVATIAPTNTLYIAFDGVAPFAKMEQQRTRRYKNTFLATLDFNNGKRLSETEYKQQTTGWNTSAITPGTQFMNTLSQRIKTAFVDPVMVKRLNVKNIIVSGADEPGEGEHKMFQYLRDTTTKNETVAVYGLDSDLIMLSLIHYFYCHNIYIFRESTSFSGNFARKAHADEPLFLNIHKLAKHIMQEMGCNTYSRCRVYDYIFMCFLLGNDFLPHFAAFNLRTTGIYTLIELYIKHIGAFVNRGFIDDKTNKIQWKWVHMFIAECAKVEHKMLVEEYKQRDKFETMTFGDNDRAVMFENAPVLLRGDEKYICPEELGWEDRYYKVALDSPRTSEFAKSVCINYLEGLEWVFKYYTQGCPHWRWKYNYHYPPLMCDLTKYVPMNDTTFIDSVKMENKPFTPNVQLAYVIPKVNHDLLPVNVQNVLKNYPEQFPDLETLKFKWIGCRYFWESHILLPDVPLSMIQQWEKEL
jgi:5'-3' exonuclease